MRLRVPAEYYSADADVDDVDNQHAVDYYIILGGDVGKQQDVAAVEDDLVVHDGEGVADPLRRAAGRGAGSA